MNQTYFPELLSLFAAFATFFFFSLLLKRSKNSRVFQRRRESLGFQFNAKESAIALKKNYSRLDAEINRIGDRIIKKAYRDRLSDLSNQSGSSSENIFSKLVRQKIYFALIGAGISFILISQGKVSFIIPIVFFTILAFFLPNSLVFIRRIFSGRYGRKLGEMATISGSSWQSQESLIRAKLISSAVIFGLSYLYLAFRSESVLSFGYLPIAVALGFFIPDVLLYNKVAKRRELFEETLPDAIDLLSMCVSAGLAFPAALAKVSDVQKGPVPEEFLRVRTEVQLGKSRNDALREMADRMKVDALRNFVNAVAQVDRFGIPISAALKEQSRELRAERKSKGREKAQKVPIKILGPVMLCFLPCVLLIVLGPAIIGILGAF